MYLPERARTVAIYSLSLLSLLLNCTSTQYCCNILLFIHLRECFICTTPAHVCTEYTPLHKLHTYCSGSRSALMR